MTIPKPFLFAPLVFFQFYLSGTIILFAFGPWNWFVPDAVTLYGFLIASQIIMLVGYLFATWTRAPAIPVGQVSHVGRLWFRTSIVANAILILPTSYARAGAIFPDVLGGILDPGAAYIENMARLSDGGLYVITEYLRILAAPIVLSLFPLTVLYWRSIGHLERWSAVVLIIFNLAIYVAVGQNKGLADLIATLSFFMVVAGLAHRVPIWATFATSSVAVSVGLVAFFSYFGMTQLLRRGGAVAGQPGSFGWSTSTPESRTAVEEVGSVNSEMPASSQLGSSLDAGQLGVDGPIIDPVPAIPADVTVGGPGAVTAAPDHIVAQLAPDFVRNVYESFARYLGQGYQALALTFDLDHSLTWGFGNSMFFARNADRLFGTDYFVSQSLPAVLEAETGWSMFHLWHSIYPWIASDVGFVGTLFVMGVAGWLLAKSWMESIRDLDPLWGTLLYLLLLLFFYVPANNQLMQSGETAFGFVALLGLVALRSLVRRFKRLSATDSRLIER